MLLLNNESYRKLIHQLKVTDKNSLKKRGKLKNTVYINMSDIL